MAATRPTSESRFSISLSALLFIPFLLFVVGWFILSCDRFISRYSSLLSPFPPSAPQGFKSHSLSFFAAVPYGPSCYTAAPAGEKVNGSKGSLSILSR